jgi:hypothetical protein
MAATRLARISSIGLVALGLPLACSGNGAGAAGDGRLFVPEDLPNLPREGEVGVTLKLVASTLVQGPAGPELYAAVRNDGDTPSCNAGISTDFVDGAGQTVASVGSPLRSKQLYRLDATTTITCIDPGQIAMSAATTVPPEVVIGDLAKLTHSFPTFGGFDGLVPVVAFTVSDVTSVPSGAGSAFRGRLTNELDVAVSAPSVTIFPLNRVGRPLGAATSSSTADVPAGDSWSFETTPVDDPGVGHAAFPAATIP